MEEKTVFALGFFDGVHLGHRALLEACREMSGQLGCRAGVVTFHNHPDGLVLGTAPGLINSPEDRALLLRQQGMVRLISLPFDMELMNCPWQTFFTRLVGEFGAAGLVCGEDFRFGRRGEGTAQKLRQAADEAGIPCRIVPQVCLNGMAVSSTHIRSLIERGHMGEANRFLGHPHVLTGQVIAGRQLGRSLGIPTANLLLPKTLVVPRFGVYACRVRVDGKTYNAVTNVGTRPTVSGKGITVESWILEYAGDLYGRRLSLEFHEFLRPERKFSSLEAMREEILRNARQTQEYLKGSGACASGENVVK